MRATDFKDFFCLEKLNPKNDYAFFIFKDPASQKLYKIIDSPELQNKYFPNKIDDKRLFHNDIQEHVLDPLGITAEFIKIRGTCNCNSGYFSTNFWVLNDDLNSFTSSITENQKQILKAKMIGKWIEHFLQNEPNADQELALVLLNEKNLCFAF